MSKRDRVGRLISQLEDRRRNLDFIRRQFSEWGNTKCVDYCDAALTELAFCISELIAANYQYEPPTVVCDAERRPAATP